MRADIIHHMAPAAPEPVGPFSHAVEAHGLIHITGQMPTWPGEPDRAPPDGIDAQTRLVMSNLEAVLTGIGLGWTDVVRVGVYLTHFERDYAPFNAIYRSYFQPNALPARTCIGVTALAKAAIVEVDLVAARR
jgi:2-iminobutanoate/2-iminopropanoate deaminase